jgi:uncharacterized protein (TIGR00251 family)
VSVRFAVRLTPRGGRDAVEGAGEDGALRCRVAAPPVEGAANEALVRLLARELGVGRGAVVIVGGETARTKQVALDGVGEADLHARWPGLTTRV